MKYSHKDRAKLDVIENLTWARLRLERAHKLLGQAKLSEKQRERLEVLSTKIELMETEIRSTMLSGASAEAL